jgi:hypothetical protein
VSKLRSCKSPSIYQVKQKLIEAGDKTLCSEIYTFLFPFGTRKDLHSCDKNPLLLRFTEREKNCLQK